MLVGLVACVASKVIQPELFDYVVVCCVWLLTSIGAAVAQRQAFRFLPPGASKITIVSVLAVAISVVVLSSLSLISLITLLVAYALIDALSGCLLFVLLRDLWSSAVMVACGVALTLVALLSV